jgi:hypothetical protein
MFFFLMQRHGFKLFDFNMAQLKNASFLCQWCPLLLSRMCLSSRGSVKDWEKLRCIQVGNLCWGTRFLSRAFEHFYIDIWLSMLLKDVLEILLLLMPKIFIDQFVFV